jgi:glyoxylase-like metal-dependent hydrolase (beta-lactamase superfamily II)
MHPLELSTHVIDTGQIPEMINRVTNELSELADDLAIVESFSHCVVWDTGDGLFCIDASSPGTGNAVVQAIRSWRRDPISCLTYTHGHADHVGGSPAFAADAAASGARPPVVVGQINVNRRLRRYDQTNLWNIMINRRQFGGISADLGLDLVESDLRFIPKDVMRPEIEVDTFHSWMFADTNVEFHHARGETDDHLYLWMPERKWIFTGDFVIWNYPNAGNPQKVQRYALEWAMALRQMAALEPELLVPAHGLPITGRARIRTVLTDTAATLEDLVNRVVAMMNEGASLDTIIHTVTVADEVLTKPYLRPLYDEPEFVIRNIWRLYGGWWDGAASRLKPAPDAVLAGELADLAGGPGALMARAQELVDTDLRLACHLADLAGWAAPTDPGIHADRAAIYRRRRDGELSLMSKGIFAAAARESEAVADRPVN